MTYRFTGLLAAAALALTACDNLDPNTVDTAGAAVAAGAIGAISATALGANTGWTIAAGVASATAGALYAQHRQRNECAYYTGNGDQVVIRPCD